MTPGTCIHYTGLLFDKGTCTCLAGVDMRATFGDEKPGIFMRMPCIQFREVPAHGRGTYCKAGEPTVRREVDRKGETMMPCALRVEPTAEQVEQDRLETDAAMERTFVAIKVASEWRVKPKPAKNRREVVECPVCKGRLHLSQSSFNGHVHGKCETEGCVSWME